MMDQIYLKGILTDMRDRTHERYKHVQEHTLPIPALDMKHSNENAIKEIVSGNGNISGNAVIDLLERNIIVMRILYEQGAVTQEKLNEEKNKE